jgi:hypothetical protein
MNAKKLPALLAALFLQFAPLLRTVEPAMLGVLQPVFVLLRWASAAAAVAGGAHALSGATGLVSATSVRGTNGIAIAYRAQISSPSYGAPRSYSATGLPPGVTCAANGLMQGSPSQAGVYTARVTGWQNLGFTGNSYTATLPFTIVEGSPAISVQPSPVTATEGGVATLSVTATGNALTYRWIRDGLELSGATNATLTLNPVKLTDAGPYQVRVQNSGGSVMSATVQLTVNPAVTPLVFTTSPVGKTVHPGESVALTAVASAAPGVTPTYSWTRNGAPVAGTSGSLVLNAITASQAGTYQAVATANGLSTTSAPAAVVVVGNLNLSPPNVSGTGVSMRAPAIPGRRYLLERATDPGASSWTTTFDRLAPGDSVELLDTAAPADAAFYRVRVAP